MVTDNITLTSANISLASVNIRKSLALNHIRRSMASAI